MTRANTYQPAINAGELSPRLHARTDFAKYANGLETCLNLIPLAEGGAMRRPGTRFVAELKDSGRKGRLKRFQFSTTQAYMLELCDRALRVYRHQGQIRAADTDAAIVNGGFAAGIANWTNRSTGAGSIGHDAANGRLSLTPGGGAAGDVAWAEQAVAIGAAFRVHEHVLKFRVIGAPGDQVRLRLGTTATGAELGEKSFAVGHHCHAFVPGAGAATLYVQFRNLGATHNKTVQIDDVAFIDAAAVEIDAPWAEAELFAVEGPQSADVLYLFHADHAPRKLERYGHASWSLVEVAWDDGPYGDANDAPTTLAPAATSGLAVTVTASGTTGINDGQGFLAGDVGRSLRISNPASGKNWGWGRIVGVTDATTVQVDIKRAFATVNASAAWMLGAWSATTGYPAAGAFFEQRLFAANTRRQPQTLWASNTGDIEFMAPDSANSAGVWDGTVEDDDGLDYTISADDVQAIRWLSPGEDTLAIGTASGEWAPSSSGAVLTPTDIVIRQQTTHGSAPVAPVRVDNVVLFVQRARRKLREFGFTAEIDGFRAPDMTRLAEHITKSGLVELAYAEEPDSLIYAVRGDGTLLTMTYRRDEDVVGWARHTFGGGFAGGPAQVESVATIPGADGAGQVATSEDRDEVWLIVKRTINGATKRYVEVMERSFEGPVRGDHASDAAWRAAMVAAQANAYFADSLVTYRGAPSATVGGLGHLEGETVKVLADGAVAAARAVTGGQIALERPASVVQIGLGYTHRGKTLKIAAGAMAGTPVGKIKTINGVGFVLLDSHTLSFGPTAETAETRDFREVGDAMDAAAPLFTGERFFEFAGGWVTDARVVYQSDDPVPFALLALAPEIVVNDVA